VKRALAKTVVVIGDWLKNCNAHVLKPRPTKPATTIPARLVITLKNSDFIGYSLRRSPLGRDSGC